MTKIKRQFITILNIHRPLDQDILSKCNIYINILDLKFQPIEVEDPIQLDSYEWEDNKPNPDYARVITPDEERAYQLQDGVASTLRKHNQVFIKSKLSPNYLLIPKSEEPHLILETKVIYVGQWANGKPFGMGSIYYPTGDLYEGQCVEGVPEGEGRKIWKDGSHYIGYFKEGCMEGQGRIRRSDKFTYEGTWKNNTPHGKGTEVWPNKTTYSGEYFEGVKQGRGRFAWDRLHKRVDETNVTKITQESYDGFFQNNAFEGEGTYEWPDGRTYEGQWKAGKMDGHGVFTWINGLKYDGHYKADTKHGEGSLIWPEGKKLHGNWRFGRMEGTGTLEVKGKTYKGEWTKGSKKVKWIRDNAGSVSAPMSNMMTDLEKVPSERDVLFDQEDPAQHDQQ